MGFGITEEVRRLPRFPPSFRNGSGILHHRRNQSKPVIPSLFIPAPLIESRREFALEIPPPEFALRKA